VSALLDKRLVFVTGKGGTGKTTVAAAIGLAAARAGKRTLVCEVAEQERIGDAFGKGEIGYQETELAPGLFAFSVDPVKAREEWVRYRLPSRTLAGVLNQSRLFGYLAAAAPGLAELVTIGKVWELAQLERKQKGASAYDLVVVDSPATGHGLAMLSAPSTIGDIARVGPIHRQAYRIHNFVSDARLTGAIAVALPEEMPVAETLDLEGRLGEEMGMPLGAIVVNGLYPERFSRAEGERLASLDGSVTAGAQAALRAALLEHERARAQRSQLRRLRRGARAPVLTLPFLFEPELGLEQLQQLSRELERRLP
jgi:anion-transporting  ArsA/GET3 family ATPase